MRTGRILLASAVTVGVAIRAVGPAPAQGMQDGAGRAMMQDGTGQATMGHGMMQGGTGPATTGAGMGQCR